MVLNKLRSVIENVYNLTHIRNEQVFPSYNDANELNMFVLIFQWMSKF